MLNLITAKIVLCLLSLFTTPHYSPPRTIHHPALFTTPRYSPPRAMHHPALFTTPTLVALCATCAYSMSHARLSETPWTAAHQDPLSMGILQARILEWVAMPSSRESSQLRDGTQVSCIAGGRFTLWATRDAQDNSARSPSEGPSWSSVLWCRCFRSSQRACLFCPLRPILDLFLELRAEMLIVTSCYTIHVIDDRHLSHNLVSAFYLKIRVLGNNKYPHTNWNWNPHCLTFR